MQSLSPALTVNSGYLVFHPLQLLFILRHPVCNLCSKEIIHHCTLSSIGTNHIVDSFRGFSKVPNALLTFLGLPPLFSHQHTVNKNPHAHPLVTLSKLSKLPCQAILLIFPSPPLPPPISPTFMTSCLAWTVLKEKEKNPPPPPRN